MLAGMAKVPGRLTLSEDDRRVLAAWAADRAEHVLPLFEAVAPDDARPREAIAGARAFAAGDLRVGPARALAVAAHGAARAVDDPAAVAAARAAGHAVATAHMASHARGVPGYAAVARVASAPGDPTAAADEVAMAVRHASPAVRDVLRRLPPPVRAGGVLGEAIRVLDASIRESG
jgi:hypothetical protein